MADAEENSSVFPIFIITIMALPQVLYTIVRLRHAFSRKSKSIHCEHGVCSCSGKYHKSIFKQQSDSCVALDHHGN